MAVIIACVLATGGALTEGAYKLTLSPSGAITLAPGDTRALSVSIEPVNLIEHIVTWTSANPYVASVSAKGQVKALAAGSTTITATIETGDKVSAQVRVTGNAVTSLIIADADIALSLGESAQLSYTMNSDADDKRVLWKSDDTSVATVDKNGKVTAVGYGTALITLLAVNGTTATASVYVPSEVQSIMLDPAEALINVGGQLAFDAYVFPGNARNRELQWEVNDIKLASVDENGVLTGLSEGECLLRARAQNGVYALAKVKIAQLPDTMSMSQSEVALSREERTAQLTVNIEPESASGCELAWKSSDERVVAVKGGALNAKGYGTAVITATALNGVTAQCTVRVCERAQAMAFTSAQHSIAVGGAPMELKLVFSPAEAYEANITWSIDDDSIATISADGLLTPVSHGVTRATAVCASGLEASCEIRVYEDARSIAFARSEYGLPEHTSLELNIMASPPDALPEGLQWESSDPAICAVLNGVLYAQSAGDVTITASVPDTQLKCECVVKVTKNADMEPKYIALTFDNGPAENTPLTLGALERFKVKATFFLLGMNVHKYPKLTALFADTEHELGNHTYQNASLNTSSLADIAIAIERTDVLIQAAAGRVPTVLRAPDANLPVKLFTTFLDTRRFVGWSADVQDSRRGATSDAIRDKALSESFDGAILTFHDSSAETAQALYEIIPALILKGYKFVTATELMVIRGDASPVFTTKK